MKKQAYQFVARCRSALRPLSNRDYSLLLWQKLKYHFPDQTLACVLMPNHLHLAIVTSRPAEAKRRLGIVLRAFSRATHPGQSLWERQPPLPLPLGNQHLARTIRYIHLNPCRARLTQDPWQWEFSTVREHSGLSVSPWINPGLAEKFLRMDFALWQEQHDRLLYQDSTVTPGLMATHLHTRIFEKVNPFDLQQIIAASRNCSMRALMTGREERNLLARAMLAHPEIKNSNSNIAHHLRMSRKQVRTLRNCPLSEKDKRALAAHANLIHNSQRMLRSSFGSDFEL